jgi:hypothetical protein
MLRLVENARAVMADATAQSDSQMQISQCVAAVAGESIEQT